MNCNFRTLIESIIEKNTEDGSELSQTVQKIKDERDTIEAVLAVTTKPLGVGGVSDAQRSQLEAMSYYVKACNVAIAYLEDQIKEARNEKIRSLVVEVVGTLGEYPNKDQAREQLEAYKLEIQGELSEAGSLLPEELTQLSRVVKAIDIALLKLSSGKLKASQLAHISSTFLGR